MRVLATAAIVCACILVVGAEPGSRHAQEPRFQPIDAPQAKATIASAINIHGEIAGRYTDRNDRVHGFIIDRTGAFITIDSPGSVFTIARGLNDHGDVVGRFETADGTGHGFVYRKGKVTQFDYPGAAGPNATFPWGINNSGVIVGRFTLPGGDGPHGFVLRNDQWTRLDHPASKTSAANGINSAGEIVGIWFDGAKNEHSYRLVDGEYASIDVPDSTRTLVDAIIDDGTVSGTYRDQIGIGRGYVMDRSGCVTAIDRDKYPGVTVVRGLNMHRKLVGQFGAENAQRGYLLENYPLRTCRAGNIAGGDAPRSMHFN